MNTSLLLLVLLLAGGFVPPLAAAAMISFDNAALGQPPPGWTVAISVEEKVAPQTWHTLLVEFVGNRFKDLFNRKPLFDMENNIFTGAGRVGLWTKADSVMLFDDFDFGSK